MDDSTLERLAEIICGDNTNLSPVYRTGSELTTFFHRAGFKRFTHDGSTRKWWTLDCLRSCNGKELSLVLKRLASPKEYGGDKEKVKQVLNSLNKTLSIEGLKIELNGIEPVIKAETPKFDIKETEDEERELKPLPPPNFHSLDIEPVIADLLMKRWEEAEKCVHAGAHLAAIIIMGSLLEGLILAVLQRKSKQVNKSEAAPRHYGSGKVKKFYKWTLNEMIEFAYNEKWIDLDVHRFSHALKGFRNLIHPYEQMSLNVFPDEDTSNICWLVVQATVNDLAKVLSKKT